MKYLNKKKEKLKFYKYTAYGNDYIVIDPNKNRFEVDKNIIEKICHRNFGIGSDGILLGPIFDKNKNKSDIFLRIFNSDGSEAEKSGNGIRIFSQYLADYGYIKGKFKKKNEIEINTKGGLVKSCFNDDGYISINMGKIEFIKEDIEIEAISENNDEVRVFKGCFLSIGNPHFVIIQDKIDEIVAKKYGKSIESNRIFPEKTNVQFTQIIDRNNIKIEIYERGSGYTLASGSSACAAAATCFKKGLIDKKVDVHMPGGVVNVIIDENYRIIQKGKAQKIYEGIFFISTFLDKFNN